MFSHSADKGRSWSKKRPLTEATQGLPFYNCPRISQLKDGRLVVIVDKLHSQERSSKPSDCQNYLYYSENEGNTWGKPTKLPVHGIVPDKLCELPGGRWIVTAHFKDSAFGYAVQRLWMSDDKGTTWRGPIIVGKKSGLNLCEASILPVNDQILVAFMRENSGRGWDCQKTISQDGGLTWGDPIPFPLPGCHRPVSGWLNTGDALITHRYMQGGLGWTGWWTQNLFAALTDKASVLAKERNDAHTRILPIDFDRSPSSDTGYSGWVQFDDGEIYIVNYIVDDAPKGQIRGYSLHMDDIILNK
jgi:sialidase-1